MLKISFCLRSVLVYYVNGINGFYVRFMDLEIESCFLENVMGFLFATFI